MFIEPKAVCSNYEGKDKRNLKNGWILTLCCVVQSKIYKEFFFLVFWEENPPYSNVCNLFRGAVGLSREVCLSQQGLCQQSCPLLYGTSHSLRPPFPRWVVDLRGGLSPFHKLSVIVSAVFFQRFSVIFAKWREENHIRCYGEMWLEKNLSV